MEKPTSYFGFDDWLTDIPEQVEGPLAGIQEYVKLLTESGVHPMSTIQALALVLGQQTAVLLEGAVDHSAAAGQVFAESLGIMSLENAKCMDGFARVTH